MSQLLEATSRQRRIGWQARQVSRLQERSCRSEGNRECCSKCAGPSTRGTASRAESTCDQYYDAEASCRTEFRCRRSTAAFRSRRESIRFDCDAESVGSCINCRRTGWHTCLKKCRCRIVCADGRSQRRPRGAYYRNTVRGPRDGRRCGRRNTRSRAGRHRWWPHGGAVSASVLRLVWTCWRGNRWRDLQHRCALRRRTKVQNGLTFEPTKTESARLHRCSASGSNRVETSFLSRQCGDLFRVGRSGDVSANPSNDAFLAANQLLSSPVFTRTKPALASIEALRSHTSRLARTTRSTTRSKGDGDRHGLLCRGRNHLFLARVTRDLCCGARASRYRYLCDLETAND